jgi:hypothetical protein
MQSDANATNERTDFATPIGGPATLAARPARPWVALTFLGPPGPWPRFTKGTHTTRYDYHSSRNTNKNWFIGLSDQGAYPRSLGVLADTPFTTHETEADLGRACDVVGLCLTDDSDVRGILEDGGLLTSLPARGIIVNHGTGDPQTAATLAQRCLE